MVVVVQVNLLIKSQAHQERMQQFVKYANKKRYHAIPTHRYWPQLLPTKLMETIKYKKYKKLLCI